MSEEVTESSTEVEVKKPKRTAARKKDAEVPASKEATVKESSSSAKEKN